MTLTPIVQKILDISSLRDIKALRTNITAAVNAILDIDNSELIHCLEYRNTSASIDEPTTLLAYHRTSPQGDIEKDPIPHTELNNDWPATSRFPNVADEPNIVPMKTNEEIGEYLLFYATDLEQESIANVEALVSVYCNQCELILIAEQDQLTGLYNRQAFSRITTAMFSTEANNSAEYHQLGSPSCMAIIDLDYFKNVNDQYGHLYGDEVLLLFTQMVKKSLRVTDYIFRYGGEEFVIILNDADSQHAFDILNRLRQEAGSFNYPEKGKITISVGYAPLEKELGISRIIDMADSALYFSKENGRNQVNSYFDLREKDLIADRLTDRTRSVY